MVEIVEAARTGSGRRAVAFRGGGFLPEPKPLYSWLTFVVLIGLWQAAISVGWLNPVFLPSPADIVYALRHLVVSGDQVVTVVGKSTTVETMTHYLTYCTELLAMVSKIGQLYVQAFSDGITLAAVDQFENLATGLSQKIWQKLMILERFRTLGTPTSA